MHVMTRSLAQYLRKFSSWRDCARPYASQNAFCASALLMPCRRARGERRCLSIRAQLELRLALAASHLVLVPRLPALAAVEVEAARRGPHRLIAAVIALLRLILGACAARACVSRLPTDSTARVSPTRRAGCSSHQASALKSGGRCVSTSTAGEARERAIVAPPGRGMIRHFSSSNDAASVLYSFTSGTA